MGFGAKSRNVREYSVGEETVNFLLTSSAPRSRRPVSSCSSKKHGGIGLSAF